MKEYLKQAEVMPWKEVWILVIGLRALSNFSLVIWMMPISLFFMHNDFSTR